VAGSGTTAGLGLVAAATWGGSDFVGGVGAKRAPALLVVASGHLVSLLILVAVCLGMHLPLPGQTAVLFAAAGGFEGAFALAIFYRALSMGPMGLTAAFTGLLTALVPVVFSLFHEGLPSPLTAAGLATGLAAIWMITRTPTAEEASRTPRAALLLGALAGTGFGAQLILFKMAGQGSLLWVMSSARAAGVAAMLLVLVVLPPKGRWRGFWLTGILAGVLDTVGNLFYIQATRSGRLDVAALVCSLYPGGTILLSAAVLKEWPSRKQWAGIALALGAVALLSL
jgi:drug/metabolite transporter (DMT)-like permease